MTLKTFVNSLKAVAVFTAAALVLLTVFCFVSYQSFDPDKNLTLFAYITLIVSFFACTLSGAKFDPASPVKCGVTAGVTALVILFAMSLAVRGNAPMSIHVLFMTLAGCASSAAGIFTGCRKARISPEKMRRELKAKYKNK